MPEGSIDAANANVEAGTRGDSVIRPKNVADVSRGRRLEQPAGESRLQRPGAVRRASMSGSPSYGALLLPCPSWRPPSRRVEARNRDEASAPDPDVRRGRRGRRVRRAPPPARRRPRASTSRPSTPPRPRRAKRRRWPRRRRGVAELLSAGPSMARRRRVPGREPQRGIQHDHEEQRPPSSVSAEPVAATPRRSHRQPLRG